VSHQLSSISLGGHRGDGRLAVFQQHLVQLGLARLEALPSFQNIARAIGNLLDSPAVCHQPAPAPEDTNESAPLRLQDFNKTTNDCFLHHDADDIPVGIPHFLPKPGTDHVTHRSDLPAGCQGTHDRSLQSRLLDLSQGGAMDLEPLNVLVCVLLDPDQALHQMRVRRILHSCFSISTSCGVQVYRRRVKSVSPT
jgi:hypothetical protein